MSAAVRINFAPAILVIGENDIEVRSLASKLDLSRFGVPNCEVVVTTVRAEAVRLLAARSFAVIVHTLAGATAQHLQPIKYLRDHENNAATAIVLIGPLDLDCAEAMRALAGGAVDCVSKPADEFVLRAKAKMFIEMAKTAVQLKDAADGRDVLTDRLTGLPTRMLMMDRAGQAIRQAARGNGRVALAVIDLDQFHDVRETLGPASGDELLRQVALRLTGALRRSDTVARIGEDEFAVVVACDTRDGVETVTQRLERAMTEPFAVGAHRITVGEGIGVALFPDHGREPAVLLDRASAVMGIAKQNRLGHLFYDPIVHVGAVEDHAATTVFNTDELHAAGAA